MIEFNLPGNLSLGPIAAVFFDKDGTLIDSHSYWGEIIKQRALMIVSYYEMDKDKVSDLCNCMGFCDQTHRLLEKGPIALESRSVVISQLANFLQSIGVSALPDEINEIFDTVTSNMNSKNLPDINLIQDGVLLLKRLVNQNFKVAIITSDSSVNTENFLKKIGLSQSQLFIVTRDSYPHAKKTGLPAKYAADHLDVDISQCLIIGDAPMDFEMAINCGALPLLVSTGQLPKNTLLQHSVNVVNSLSEVNFSPISI